MTNKRLDGRSFSELRQIKCEVDAFGHADASVLFELGNTKVLASVSLQPNVPPFLKGHRVGWLTAEYAMLPCATQQRTIRETNQFQRNARNVEISRLIGRCLRTIVNLEQLGERTIMVDCDVLQADGSTRVASITAASLALEQAVSRWLAQGIIEQNIIKEPIVAVSAGIIHNTPYLDLSYQEDNQAEADFNFVMTQQGNIIEIQGTAEKRAISWTLFEDLKTLAQQGATTIFSWIQENQGKLISTANTTNTPLNKPPLFSLANRMTNKGV